MLRNMWNIGAHRRTWSALAALFMATSMGCSLFQPIQAIPANRIPPEFLGRSRTDMQEISFSRLRQRPASFYQLGPNDILGIYVETILGEQGTAPPVHFPDEGQKDPAIGFPIPIREDGTISLPLIPAIDVSGLTVEQTTELIRKAYTEDQKLLPPGESRIIVTLLKRRTSRVLVIRQETGGVEGVTKKGTGFLLDLPANENDLLHALNQTGGLPGADAKNEILIIRGDSGNAACYDDFIAQLKLQRQPCSAPTPVPDPPNVTRIPLRFFPENPPRFTEEDIILNTGDIVLIESREEEKFYTGGVLEGGEHLLPRDYDLDVLQAIAISGGAVAGGGAVLQGSGLTQRGRVGSGGRSSGGPLPPSEAVVVRKLPNGTTLPILVNLKQAVTDSSQRVLIQPEDMVIVRYTCEEDIINTLLGMLQFNILFNGGGGGGF